MLDARFARTKLYREINAIEPLPPLARGGVGAADRGVVYKTQTLLLLRLAAKNGLSLRLFEAICLENPPPSQMEARN